MPNFAGALYCNNDLGCSVYPVAVGDNFTGVYGTGEAVEAASSSTTLSTANRRRRRSRRLDSTRQSEEGDAVVFRWDEGAETNVFDDGDGGGEDQDQLGGVPSLPGPEKIERYMRTRYVESKPSTFPGSEILCGPEDGAGET